MAQMTVPGNHEKTLARIFDDMLSKRTIYRLLESAPMATPDEFLLFLRALKSRDFDGSEAIDPDYFRGQCRRFVGSLEGEYGRDRK